MSAIAFSGVKDSGKTISSKIYRYLYVKWLWDEGSSFEEFKDIINIIILLDGLSFATNIKEILSIILDIDIKYFNDRGYKDKFWFNPYSRTFISENKLKERVTKRRTLVCQDTKQIKYDSFNDEDFFVRLRTIIQWFGTVRTIMQWFGTDVAQKHFGNNVWINSIINKIKDNPNNLFIIDDVRFKAEYEACLNNNIPVYKIINSKFTSKDKHVSETDLDSMIWDEDKIIVWNGEDLEELYNKIKKIFDYEFTRSK